MITNILVPVDGSKNSEKALSFACDFATKYNAGLNVLHVVQHPPGEHVLALGAASVTIKSSPEELQEAGRQVIEASKKIVEDHACKLEGAEVAQGDPVQRILDAASKHDADLIVMGSRGLSNLAGLMMGSVSDKVTHLSDRTCITVR